jgi:hypothetical protein
VYVVGYEKQRYFSKCEESVSSPVVLYGDDPECPECPECPPNEGGINTPQVTYFLAYASISHSPNWQCLPQTAFDPPLQIEMSTIIRLALQNVG